MGIDVRDLIGNRLRLEKDVIAYSGSPNSPDSTTWKAGRLTPVIDSWIQQDGEVWYQFSEVPPVQYIKHDPQALEVEAYEGGAKYLEDDTETDYGVNFESAAGLLDLLTVKNLSRVIKLVIAVVLFLIGWNVYGLFK